ncbi:MAG: cobaltochelatase subunit CobN [Chloroflexota bacterium]
MTDIKKRSRVLRTDGKLINIVHHRGHLLICSKGCCCGLTERGFAPVPEDLYHHEWESRKLRNRVHLTQSGCLGPCTMANVVLLMFDGHPIWFQSINTEALIRAIFDYIDAMLEADKYLPPPPNLTDYVFDYYTWSHRDGISSEVPQKLLPPSEDVKQEDILILTHKDTDLLTLSTATANLPEDFPPVDYANLLNIKNDAHMIDMLNEKAGTAAVILVRLLGRVSSVPGFGHLLDHVRQHDQQLIVVSGTGSIEPDFMAMSTVPVDTIHTVMRYFEADGYQNMTQMLHYLADHLLRFGFGYDAPIEQAKHGIYHPSLPKNATLADWQRYRHAQQATVAVLFYRSHWLSGNTAFVDALLHELEAHGLNAIGIFSASLRQHSANENVNGKHVNRLPDAFNLLLADDGTPFVDAVINTISFAMGDVNPDGATLSTWSAEGLEALDIPILQAITSGGTRWSWEGAARGLNPLDTAMNVAMPEFDGRIITVPISFKEKREPTSDCCADGTCAESSQPDAEVIHYAPVADRVAQVVKQVSRLVTLRRKPNHQKRIAFMLTNSTGKAQSIGNAVGLDAPASLMQVFNAMQTAGYKIDNLPPDGDVLIQQLIARCSYDEIYLTEAQLANAVGRVPADSYDNWFAQLPDKQRDGMTRQWGDAPGEAYVHDEHIGLAGVEFGNIFVGLQPPRGYGMDPDTIYHMPDLAPPHNYYAYYRWLRDEWGADAIVHMGKHGTLEWLPGKGIGLSAECYPDTFLDDMPLIYPFILNDPGEGAQAKRRAHAVIIDHLTPPMTTADGYGELAQLMQLVDEYYQVEQFDPSKLPLIQRQIWELMQAINLQDDLAAMLKRDHGDHVHEWDDEMTDDGTPVTLAEMDGSEIAHLIEDMDGYLCELAGAQIRDGLHILGQMPQGDHLIDTLHALTRLPNLNVPSLRATIADTFDLDLDTLLAEQGARLTQALPNLAHLADRPIVTNGDAISVIDELAKHLLMLLADKQFNQHAINDVIQATFGDLPTHKALNDVLAFVCEILVPSLDGTQQEIDNLIHALDGGFIPAGPSGAPTRGMAHVLPTGRNFYAVDPRTLPSIAAWEVGQGLAREVLGRYLTETGDYPESVAISVWGTSAMRTHGDDVAEIFALLGVRPRWQRENHRVLGVELIPLAELGRPRIDVTVRISGFFRDAFPHLIQLMDDAVNLVIDADEPIEQNFVRKHYLADRQEAETDDTTARYRIFGSKPGTYGAGILPLIDNQNWQDDDDFAETYVNWGGYAYTNEAINGVDAREQFIQRLTTVEVALHNQDNREHDIFDSDDYLQFHGGMIATIRALSGQQPKHYFGDTQNPATPKVRDLKEEALRVYRTRVVNPKWLESITQHGYKGALEMAATVDYLFGYDATASVVSDFMYEQVAQDYALDSAMQDFFQQSNPWALRAISERLLEAAQRGMWSAPNAETIDALRETLLKTDTMLEGGQDA